MITVNFHNIQNSISSLAVTMVRNLQIPCTEKYEGFFVSNLKGSSREHTAEDGTGQMLRAQLPESLKLSREWRICSKGATQNTRFMTA
jgi:hypothetical protein